MRVLVTGGSGKIGSAIATEMLDHGHEVLCVDVRADEAPDPRLLSSHVIDLGDIEALTPLMNGVDAVCHMGNLPGSHSFGEAGTFSRNISATFNVLHAAGQAGVRRIVNASSIQVYGSSGTHPVAPRYLPLDEKHPHQAMDGYSLSKSLSEPLCEAFTRLYSGSQAFSLRFTAVRVPRVEALWEKSKCRTQRKSSGGAWAASSLWTFVRVEDVARAARLCCEIDRPGHTALNIVAGKSSIPWEPSWIEEFFGVMPPFTKPVGPDEALMTGELAKQVLGFEATLPARDQTTDQVAR